MKEFIQNWKEFKEDQEVRFKAMKIDPDYLEWLNVIHLGTYTSRILMELNLNIIKTKYGIIELTFESLMDWVINDKPKFKGIEIKVKE